MFLSVGNLCATQQSGAEEKAERNANLRTKKALLDRIAHKEKARDREFFRKRLLQYPVTSDIFDSITAFVHSVVENPMAK